MAQEAPIAGAHHDGYVPDIWRIASVTVLGSIMTVLDSTIVNVALESLSHDLHSSLDSVQWVVTGYMLALGAVIPVAGWLSRRVGAKRLYLVSIVLFTVGSVLCGISTSIGELIVFRVVQGVGGGLVAPVGQMILVRASGPERLARVMAAIGVPTVMAPVLGPTIGGLLIDNIGWRWIFFVNVPIGIVAVITGAAKLPSDRAEKAGPFDLAGLVLSAAGLVALTYGLAEVAAPASILTHVVAPVVGGLVLLAVYVVRSLRIPTPLLNLRLYLNRAFAASSVTMFTLGAALFGSMILMPLYFQTVRGEDALFTGLLVAPRGIGAAVAMWYGGKLTDRYGAGLTSAMGCVVAAAFSVPFVLLGAHTSYWTISVFMALQGAGMGFTVTPAFTAAFRALPAHVVDAAPQLNIIMRVGGSMGTAILTVLLQDRLVHARTLGAQAGAFGTTFGWVVIVVAVAIIPTLVLVSVERRNRSGGGVTGGGAEAETLHGAVELG